MTKEFLEKLGIDAETASKILEQNKAEIYEQTTKEAAKTAVVQEKLSKARADLEALRQSSGEAAAIQQQLSDLQAKYDADTADLTAKLAERNYMDAVRAAVSGKGLKFSSKAAERDFLAQAKAKQMELKDGALTGFDDFVTAQREADPYAFASDKPTPHFVGPVGTGGAPPATLPPNVAQAREMGAARAATMKASNDAMKAFM